MMAPGAVLSLTRRPVESLRPSAPDPLLSSTPHLLHTPSVYTVLLLPEWYSYCLQDPQGYGVTFLTRTPASLGAESLDEKGTSNRRRQIATRLWATVAGAG